MNHEDRLKPFWPHIEAIAGPHPDDIDQPCPTCRVYQREAENLHETLDRTTGRINGLLAEVGRLNKSLRIKAGQVDSLVEQRNRSEVSSLICFALSVVFLVFAVWGWAR